MVNRLCDSLHCRMTAWIIIIKEMFPVLSAEEKQTRILNTHTHKHTHTGLFCRRRLSAAFLKTDRSKKRARGRYFCSPSCLCQTGAIIPVKWTWVWLLCKQPIIPPDFPFSALLLQRIMSLLCLIDFFLFCEQRACVCVWCTGELSGELRENPTPEQAGFELYELRVSCITLSKQTHKRSGINRKLDAV